MGISTEELEIVRKAVRLWEEAVNATDLKYTTKLTYTNHPRRMVQWLQGTYRLPSKR